MSLRQTLGRIGRWPRFAAAAACLLLAAVSALESTAAPPRDRSARGVVVAVRALPAGHTLTTRDLTTRDSAAVWPGTLTRPRSLLGRVLAGPVARGEPVTALRLLDPGLTTGLPPGVVAMPVDIATDVRGLVPRGGRVDLLAVPDSDGVTGSNPDGSGSAQLTAERVATRALVLAVLPPDASGTGGGCRLVLALDRDDALHIAGVRSTRLFHVAALSP